MEAVLEGMDEYYSAELSQKIKRGMRENIYKSKTTGGYTALGYKVGADKRLEIDERGAAIVRMIFTEYDSGKIFAEICAMLNDAGYVTQRGKAFRHDTLSRICSNRKYIGEYTSDMVAEPSTCPAIIDRDLWGRVQTKLKNSKQKHRHTNPKHDYLLTGFLTCSQCGKPIRGTAGTSKTGKRYYYYKCDTGCYGRLPAYQLEDTIVHALEDALTPEKCDEIADKAYTLYQKERAENVQLQAAKAEKKVEKKLQNAFDAVLSGIHSQGLKTMP